MLPRRCSKEAISLSLDEGREGDPLWFHPLRLGYQGKATQLEMLGHARNHNPTNLASTIQQSVEDLERGSRKTIQTFKESTYMLYSIGSI